MLPLSDNVQGDREVIGVRTFGFGTTRREACLKWDPSGLFSQALFHPKHCRSQTWLSRGGFLPSRTATPTSSGDPRDLWHRDRPTRV